MPPGGAVHLRRPALHRHPGPRFLPGPGERGAPFWAGRLPPGPPPPVLGLPGTFGPVQAPARRPPRPGPSGDHENPLRPEVASDPHPRPLLALGGPGLPQTLKAPLRTPGFRLVDGAGTLWLEVNPGAPYAALQAFASEGARSCFLATPARTAASSLPSSRRPCGKGGSASTGTWSWEAPKARW